MEPCADACDHLVVDIGADYTKAKQCVLNQKPKIESAIACVEDALKERAVCNDSKVMVPKRYAETLELAGIAEIEKMMIRSKVALELNSLLAHGKKFFTCMRKCMDNKADHCITKTGCGLALPADKEVIQMGKQCAINAGFTTPVAQTICQCGLAAGIKHFQGVCARIQISK